jgi:hypothetical protein
MTQHNDFLKFKELKDYNKRFERIIMESEEQPIPYDNNRFISFIKRPEDIDEDVLYMLSDLVDKKTQLDEKTYKTDDFKGPNTVDKLADSLAIAYILDDNIPVAVATLVDPTIENYKGFIPSDYYELKTGYQLENRLQQEYFVVKDELNNMGLSSELRGLLETITPNMFTVVSSVDEQTISGLAKNGYNFIAELDTDWDYNPVQLWIN